MGLSPSPVTSWGHCPGRWWWIRDHRAGLGQLGFKLEDTEGGQRVSFPALPEEQ